MDYGQERSPVASEVDVRLDRDEFLRTLVQKLAGTLESVIGLDEAAGFVSIVGQEVGVELDQRYRNEMRVDALDSHQIADVLVDLKRRIQGDFRVTYQDEERIEFANRACPFGDRVVGHPSMCMMTSNVFGSIAAENLGYAKVVLGETIAMGAAGCSVVVHTLPTPAADAALGREYFASEAD
jgi:predicted ArsR family transcriptional regulator